MAQVPKGICPLANHFQRHQSNKLESFEKTYFVESSWFEKLFISRAKYQKITNDLFKKSILKPNWN